MPRTARIAPKEYVYHVMTRGNNRQVVFKDDEDYIRYLEILQQYREKYKFKGSWERRICAGDAESGAAVSQISDKGGKQEKNSRQSYSSSV
ncbi:MAG: hypothetical protein NTX06_08120 [Proteobacteria bacterium]|nr:hypothetical protein [Pseudomonadota bacterium]